MTLVSRDKRQIVGYDIAFDKSRERIQNLVDRSSNALQYYFDAYSAYSEICYEDLYTSQKLTENVNSEFIHYLFASVLNAFSNLWC